MSNSNNRLSSYLKDSKVIIIFLLSVFGSRINLSAQSNYNEYGSFIGGLVAGANFVQVDGDGYRGYQKTTPTGGGIIYFPIADAGIPFPGTLAWSMEVLYSQKGAFGDGVGASPNMISQEITLHYAEVPILVNWYRNPRKSIYGMGFALSALGASTEKITLYNGDIYKYPFRKYDVSFVMSLNFHIAKGFFLNPRFNYSLVSIRKKDSGASAYGRENQFNNVLGLRIMYLFDVRGRQ